MGPSLQGVLALAILCFSHCTQAKFQTIYHPQDFPQAGECIAASANVTSRVLRCQHTFACVFDKSGSDRQAIYAGASAILSLIPTVLFLLGNTNRELILISTRHPILAFALSALSINGNVGRFEWISTSPGAVVPQNQISLGPYGLVRTKFKALSHRQNWLLAAIHVVVFAFLGLLVYQVVELGTKGLLTWACWTDFYPAIWLLLGPLQHACLYLFLRIATRQSKTFPATGSGHSPKSASSESLKVAILDDNCHPEVVHERLLYASKAIVDIAGNTTYIFGTAVFSSLTLVDPGSALKILGSFGGAAIVTRIVAAWLLKEIAVVDKVTQPG